MWGALGGGLEVACHVITPANVLAICTVVVHRLDFFFNSGNI